MKTSRRLRFLAAVLALAGVLFAQLAISAYACPGEEAMAVPTMQADMMPGCDMAPPDQARSALCKAHCQQGDQSRDSQPAAATMAALCEHPVAILTLAPPGVDSLPPDAQTPLLERRTGPSLAVRHCCFRI